MPDQGDVQASETTSVETPWSDPISRFMGEWEAHQASRPRNFASGCDDRPAVLNVSLTQRRQLRYVAKNDGETFTSMVEAIKNAESDDQPTSEWLMEAEQKQLQRDAQFDRLRRERLRPRLKAIAAFVERHDTTLRRILRNDELLQRCADELGYELVLQLELDLIYVESKGMESFETELSVEVANGLIGNGRYDEPGGVLGTGLAVVRDGRALVALQAAAALGLVDSREQIELAEQNDRRGGRPRKGARARSAHMSERVTSETKRIFEDIKASGLTSSDILELIAFGYRKAQKAGFKASNDGRAFLARVAAALDGP